jgi:membrane protein
MSDTDGPDGDAPVEEEPGAAGADRVETVEQRVEYADIAELRRELDRLEADLEDRTVRRDALESDLKRYVRRRVRRGKARGWGPYLVLLYGTAMTLGAFFFLSGVWAILALIIVWLSTLGLYALMVLVGVTVTLAGLPGRLRETVEDVRD